jgi:malate dehydrogenase (oxaloacetate-decarboxylating)(NADP+)
VAPGDIDQGLLYPPLRDLREISSRIAAAVAKSAFAAGGAGIEPPANLMQSIRTSMFDPTY